MKAKRLLSSFLAVALTVTTIGMSPITADAAKKYVKLNKKSISLTVGQKAKIKVVPIKKSKKSKNNLTKKVKWSVSNKKVARIVSHNTGINKANATVKGLAAGKAVVKATIKGKYNKKNVKATLKCKVKVTADPLPNVITETNAPVVNPPVVTEGPTAEPTVKPTEGPTPDPTEVPTPIPTRDPSVTPIPGTELELDLNNYSIPSWVKGVTATKNDDGSLTINWSEESADYDNVDFLFTKPQNLSTYKQIVVETSESVTFHIKVNDAKLLDEYELPAAVGLKYNAQFPYTDNLADILNPDLEGADYSNVKGVSIMKDTGTAPRSITIRSIRFVRDVADIPPGEDVTPTQNPNLETVTTELSLDSVSVPSWVKGVTTTKNADGSLTVNWSSSSAAYDNVDFYFDTPMNLSSYEKLVIETADSKAFHIKILDAVKTNSYDLPAAVGLKYNAQFPYEGTLASMLSTDDAADADFSNVKGISIMKDERTEPCSLTIKSIKFIGTKQTDTPSTPTQSPSQDTDALELDLDGVSVPSWVTGVTTTKNADGSVTVNWSGSSNAYDNIDFYFDTPMDLSGYENIVVDTADNKTFHIKVLDATKTKSYDIAAAVGLQYEASFPYTATLASILSTNDVSDPDYTNVKGISIMKGESSDPCSLTIKSIKFTGKNSTPSATQKPSVNPTQAPSQDTEALELSLDNVVIPEWVTGITTTKNSDGTLTIDWSSESAAYDNVDFYFDTPMDLSGYENIVVDTADNKTFHIKVLDAAKTNSYDIAAAVGLQYEASFPYTASLASILSTNDVSDPDYTNVKGISIMKDTSSDPCSLTVKSIRFEGSGSQGGSGNSGSAEGITLDTSTVTAQYGQCVVTKETDGSLTVKGPNNGSLAQKVSIQLPETIKQGEKIQITLYGSRDTSQNNEMKMWISDSFNNYNTCSTTVTGVQFGTSYTLECTGSSAGAITLSATSNAIIGWLKLTKVTVTKVN